jgi:uncharacterized protein HemX
MIIRRQKVFSRNAETFKFPWEEGGSWEDQMGVPFRPTMPEENDPRRLNTPPAGLPTAETQVEVPDKIESPVPVSSSAPVEIKEDKGGMSKASKAGLIGAGVAAVGAGGYAAYRAWKKKQAKKKAAKAQAETKFNKKEDKK